MQVSHICFFLHSITFHYGATVLKCPNVTATPTLDSLSPAHIEKIIKHGNDVGPKTSPTSPKCFMDFGCVPLGRVSQPQRCCCAFLLLSKLASVNYFPSPRLQSDGGCRSAVIG